MRNSLNGTENDKCKKYQDMNEKLFWKTDVYYTLTFNPCDTLQFYNKKNRVGIFYNQMKQRLDEVFTGEYEMVMEISEPYGEQRYKYAGPRLHLHGVFKFYTLLQLQHFMFYGYTSLCAQGDIFTGLARESWADYMIKQQIIPNNYRIIKSDTKRQKAKATAAILQAYKETPVEKVSKRKRKKKPMHAIKQL